MYIHIICLLSIFGSFAAAKNESLLSEYIPESIEELQKVSVAMNCLASYYGNASNVQDCIECFFPVNQESINCYARFYTGSNSDKCFLPIVRDLTEDNKESLLLNITSCVDFNLRVKTIDFCVKKLSLNPYQKRDQIVKSVNLCFEENVNLLFREALEALEASSVGSFNPVKESVLDRTYHIEIISKCEEISEATLKECKACFNEVLDKGDVPTIFAEALSCSDKYLNYVFGKCFNSENFSGKTFKTSYEAKRAMGSCLHENTDTILKDICTYNLPGDYTISPRPQEIYSLVSACVDYHHIKLHNAHFSAELLESLRLHDDYILAVNGINQEVKEFFDNIVISQVQHHD